MQKARLKARSFYSLTVYRTAAKKSSARINLRYLRHIGRAIYDGSRQLAAHAAVPAKAALLYYGRRARRTRAALQRQCTAEPALKRCFYRQDKTFGKDARGKDFWEAGKSA